jgi:flagellar biogenesis protein FliO
MDLLQVFSQLGLPAGLIVTGVYFLSRLGQYMAPLLAQVTDKHIELIETLKEQSVKQTSLLESQNQVLERHDDLLLQIHAAVAHK